MSNVYSHPGWWRQDGTPPPPPPTDMDLTQRVSKLETIAEKTSDRLVVIEKDLSIIKTQMDGFTKHYATKADLTEATVAPDRQSVVFTSSVKNQRQIFWAATPQPLPDCEQIAAPAAIQPQSATQSPK